MAPKANGNRSVPRADACACSTKAARRWPRRTGHASILMTVRYAHLAPEIARDAVRLLDGSASRRSVVAA